MWHRSWEKAAPEAADCSVQTHACQLQASLTDGWPGSCLAAQPWGQEHISWPDFCFKAEVFSKPVAFFSGWVGNSELGYL